VAREAPPVPAGEEPDPLLSGALLKQKRNPPSTLDRARNRHRPLYDAGMRLTECVRLRVQNKESVIVL